MSEPATILIVDDDATLRTAVGLMLTKNGYRVADAADGRAALEAVKKAKPAVVLLDVEMPGMDGWRTLKALREQGSDVPVLMFTHVDDVDSRVHGLETGADDYIGKPCAPAELLARLRALIRRSHPKPPPGDLTLLRLGDVVIDLKTRHATRAGQPLRLSRTDYALLHLLNATPGLPVARETIAEKIWEGGAGSSQALDTHLWRLRKKLGDDAAAPRWIQNVPGYGYLLAAT